MRWLFWYDQSFKDDQGIEHKEWILTDDKFLFGRIVPNELRGKKMFQYVYWQDWGIYPMAHAKTFEEAQAEVTTHVLAVCPSWTIDSDVIQYPGGRNRVYIPGAIRAIDIVCNFSEWRKFIEFSPAHGGWTLKSGLKVDDILHLLE